MKEEWQTMEELGKQWSSQKDEGRVADNGRAGKTMEQSEG